MMMMMMMTTMMMMMVRIYCLSASRLELWNRALQRRPGSSRRGEARVYVRLKTLETPGIRGRPQPDAILRSRCRG